MTFRSPSIRRRKELEACSRGRSEKAQGPEISGSSRHTVTTTDKPILLLGTLSKKKKGSFESLKPQQLLLTQDLGDAGVLGFITTSTSNQTPTTGKL